MRAQTLVRVDSKMDCASSSLDIEYAPTRRGSRTVYVCTMRHNRRVCGRGHQRNMTLYAELMEATGKNYSIENCHWGSCTDSDDSSCPTVDW
jgi:hypothetical protein